MKFFENVLALLLSVLLTGIPNIVLAQETGPAGGVLRVPSTGGKARIGPLDLSSANATTNTLNATTKLSGFTSGTCLFGGAGTLNVEATSNCKWDSTGKVLSLGTATAAASAKFQVDSTTQGVLIPRMTTTQRDAIATPAQGLQIYNITTLALNIYNGTNWGEVGGGGGGGIGTELLVNADFEQGGVGTSWITTGLTSANVTSGNFLIDKKYSASLTATAIGQTFKSAAYPIMGLSGGQCAASLRYLYTGNTGDWTLTVVSSTASPTTVATLALPASTSANTAQTIIFPCGTTAATTLTFILTSTIAAPGVLYFDNAHLGSVQLYQGLTNGLGTNVVTITTSSTYVVSTGATQIEVMLVGGGGGGGASGTSAGTTPAGTGGTTSFGTTLLVATGGTGGGINGGGGIGGTATTASPVQPVLTATGGGGMSVTSSGTGSSGGGAGGQSLFGGGPSSSAGTGNQAVLAPTPQANSGSGGSGAQWNGGTGFGGSGGGAGGYADGIIVGPLAASYPIVIGIGGTAASAGTSGAAGAAGASGKVIIKETFNQITQQAYLSTAGGLAAGDLVGSFAGQCPTGTILADGTNVSRAAYPQLWQAMGTLYGAGDGSTTFTLPNGQAAFLRGSGAQTFGGVGYSAIQGTTQADQMQGHQVQYQHPTLTNNTYGSGGQQVYDGPYASQGSLPYFNSTSPVTDGTNGTPRLGLETRPLNIALKFCVRVGAANPGPIQTNGVVSNDNTQSPTIINTTQSITSATATVSTSVDTVNCNATAAAVTATMPDATFNKSKRFYLKKVDSSANLCNFATVSSQTFPSLGVTVIKMGALGDNTVVVSDGANWQVENFNVATISSYGLTTPQTVAAQTNLKYDTKIRDVLGNYSTSTGLWTLSYTGQHRITGAFYNNTGTVNMYAKVGGTSVGYVSISANANIYNGSLSFYGTAGQTVGLYNDGGAANFTQPGTGGNVNSASLERTGN